MPTISRIRELTAIISSNTAMIDDFLLTNALAQPSFDYEGPLQPLPPGYPELEKARDLVLEASIELQQLLQGVDALLKPETNLASLHALLYFNIPSLLPIGEETTFAELATKSNINVNDLRRIIRHAICHFRVFHEPKPGYVAHSAASRRMAESEQVRGSMWLSLDMILPASVKTSAALEKFQLSQEPNHTGLAIANNTTDNFYKYISNDATLAKNFSRAMLNASHEGLFHLAEAFAWDSLPTDTLVLDLGGSNGHVSKLLASRFPHLRFVVQDLPEAIQGNPSTERIKFITHDFFQPQDSEKMEKVDVVLMRYIFHNWSDNYCIQILEHLRSILKKGTKIVVQDKVIPPPGTLSLMHERELRSIDMTMLTLMNAREREESDWLELFKSADPRYRVVTCKPAKEGEVTPVIVAIWDDE